MDIKFAKHVLDQLKAHGPAGMTKLKASYGGNITHHSAGVVFRTLWVSEGIKITADGKLYEIGLNEKEALQ